MIGDATVMLYKAPSFQAEIVEKENPAGGVADEAVFDMHRRG